MVDNHLFTVLCPKMVVSTVEILEEVISEEKKMVGIGIYAKNSKEAVNLYCKAFGLTLGYHVLLGSKINQKLSGHFFG
ncbi:MAG: hypothetical protein JW976_01635 [Syntrophaceae bacterium]|nr:hypothetical protein [Syntrophaceae bacterium]